jgi:hypothetical protein
VKRYFRYGEWDIDLETAEVSQVGTHMNVLYPGIKGEIEWSWDFYNAALCSTMVGLINERKAAWREYCLEESKKEKEKGNKKAVAKRVSNRKTKK